MEDKVTVWVAVVAIVVFICMTGCFFLMLRKIRHLEAQKRGYQSIVNQSLETFAHAIDAKSISWLHFFVRFFLRHGKSIPMNPSASWWSLRSTGITV